MNIAVIGSGISGLTAAYLLSKQHTVSVYEANDYVGGHTATKDVHIRGRHYSVDTGFIVFNDWTYPNFIKLLTELGVSSQNTEMGFSVTTKDDSLEYCGNNLSTLFCNKKNLINPRFQKMLYDITRFNRIAKRDLHNNAISDRSRLEDYLDRYGFGRLFIEGYIVPMASAIWSASTRTIRNFDTLFILRFFENHGLLNLNDRPQWRVIENGSRSYIEPMIQSFKDRIYLNTPVKVIERQNNTVKIITESSERTYDQAIVACHSDQALSMLQNPSDEEHDFLSSIPYSESAVTLHTDDSILPRRHEAWASWNYFLQQSMSRQMIRHQSSNQQPLLTYNMNILQSLDCPETICVTVNGDDLIDPSKVLARYRYAHPQFNQSSIHSQNQWEIINGVKNTWFCGAYWANGFHEDGVISAVRVARHLGVDW